MGLIKVPFLRWNELSLDFGQRGIRQYYTSHERYVLITSHVDRFWNYQKMSFSDPTCIRFQSV